MVNPDKALTPEEQKILTGDVKIMHENFIYDVTRNRVISVEKVLDLADGSSMLSMQAKEMGLINEIGSWDEVGAFSRGEVR